MTSTNLQNVVAISIKRSLNQFDHEDAVGAAGLSVQAGVCNLPFLLTWTTQERLLNMSQFTRLTFGKNRPQHKWINSSAQRED